MREFLSLPRKKLPRNQFPDDSFLTKIIRENIVNHARFETNRNMNVEIKP